MALDPAQLVCFGLEGSREERKGRKKPNRVPHEVPLLLRMSTTVEMSHGGIVVFWRSKGEADTEQIPCQCGGVVHFWGVGKGDELVRVSTRFCGARWLMVGMGGRIFGRRTRCGCWAAVALLGWAASSGDSQVRCSLQGCRRLTVRGGKSWSGMGCHFWGSLVPFVGSQWSRSLSGVLP